jgi:pantoate--beta-alanine ligase
VIQAEPLAAIDYIAVVDRETLQPIDKIGNNEALVALAARFGKVRLIDNILLNQKQ